MLTNLFLVLSAFLSASSIHALVSFYLPPPNRLSDVPFTVNAGYLAQNIRFEPINVLKTEIEHELCIKLIDRGEAHITAKNSFKQ